MGDFFLTSSLLKSALPRPPTVFADVTDFLTELWKEDVFVLFNVIPCVSLPNLIPIFKNLEIAFKASQ